MTDVFQKTALKLDSVSGPPSGRKLDGGLIIDGMKTEPGSQKDHRLFLYMG